LARYIVEGSRDGLENDLQEGLAKYTPLEIINGPLLKGMEEVGVLFNQNQLIVAEVLQSAEIMKSAVNILEPHMEKAEEAVKGKILLATVKGDVHDIGKNLVEIILTNNGYKVINLGVKVSSEQLIEASKREKPDVIGLSGLLVKSVQQMLLTAQDLRDAGINIPLILGGAALSRKFTEEKIAPEYNGPVLYARDAMNSLTLLNNLLNNSGDRILNISEDRNLDNSAAKTTSGSSLTKGRELHPSSITYDSLCRPANTERRLELDYPLEKLIPYLDFSKILKHYFGAGKVKTEKMTDKLQELRNFLHDFLIEILQGKLIRANAVYALFPAFSSGDSIFILDPADEITVLEEFCFPRQKKGDGLCLADYVHPKSEGKIDYLAMFAVTTGLKISEQAGNYKENGEYLKSFLLQALALEMAEAFAEHLHEEIRNIWGLAENQGIRVSPGYAIFPEIESQKKIFRLLEPEEAGIVLTDGMMMDPEASITALVFSHPQARIFGGL